MFIYDSIPDIYINVCVYYTLYNIYTINMNTNTIHAVATSEDEGTSSGNNSLRSGISATRS